MVSRIGHVGLRVTDLGRSVAFAQDILGLREVERVGDTSYLTCNTRHHELVLIQSEEAGCDHLAFEAFDPEGVDRLRDAVTARGLPILDEPIEAGIEGAVRFVAPGGFVIEVFHGMATDQPARYATAGVRPRKFEHITVLSSCMDDLEALLVEMLGLRVSDRAADRVTWMRASEEHHGVSIMRATVDRLHHYAWQIDGWDAMRRIGDRLLLDDRTFLWGPGHHGIGDNYFSYFYDDDGAIVEYSADILRVEDEGSHVPRTWPDEDRTVNLWGNPPPPADFVAGGVRLVHRGRRSALTVRLWDANWMAIESYLEHDDRVVVPLGSTEQHGYLSLGVDAILCERAADEAAEPLGVPVLPALPFGLTPTFTAYPGTINLRMQTYLALVRDILDSLCDQGFRRILLVNGHGGNAPAANLAQEWAGEHPDCQVLFHGWLIDPAIWGLAAGIDEVAHASWVENFPVVRLEGVEIPGGRKPLVDGVRLQGAGPAEVRELMGDGPGGGPYQRPDEDTERVWAAAVELVRSRLESGWGTGSGTRSES